MDAYLTADERAIVVTVPLRVQRRGGRKQVVTPVGISEPMKQPSRPDNAVVHALTRAHRWKRMLESDRYPSIRALAEAEKVNESYLCRMLRLTLLAPDIVEMILDGRQLMSACVLDLLKPLPANWASQRQILVPSPL
jgi:hypothetical protein